MEGECSLFGKEKLTAFLKTFPISCPSILTVYCVIKAAVAPSTLGDLIDERATWSLAERTLGGAPNEHRFSQLIGTGPEQQGKNGE